ncbi:hypothetical protein [Roseomonas alba]|nr:hypothetical protein [Neoroseomonas alba]
MPVLVLLGLLGACAPEPPPEEPLPPPPPPAPPRAQVSRVAPRVVAPAASAVAADAAARPAEGPLADRPPPAWHVARDGVTGCADRGALSMLRQAAEGTPRLLAEARAAGGCRTTFRVNEWALLSSEGDAVQLRLTNGAPLTLWFQRSDVAAPSP